MTCDLSHVSNMFVHAYIDLTSPYRSTNFDGIKPIISYGTVIQDYPGTNENLFNVCNQPTFGNMYQTLFLTNPLALNKITEIQTPSDLLNSLILNSSRDATCNGANNFTTISPSLVLSDQETLLNSAMTNQTYLRSNYQPCSQTANSVLLRVEGLPGSTVLSSVWQLFSNINSVTAVRLLPQTTFDVEKNIKNALVTVNDAEQAKIALRYLNG